MRAELQVNLFERTIRGDELPVANQLAQIDYSLDGLGEFRLDNLRCYAVEKERPSEQGTDTKLLHGGPAVPSR